MYGERSSLPKKTRLRFQGFKTQAINVHEIYKMVVDRIISAASSEIEDMINQGLDPTDPGCTAMLENHLECVLEDTVDYGVRLTITRNEDRELVFDLQLMPELKEVKVRVFPHVYKDQESEC